MLEHYQPRWEGRTLQLRVPVRAAVKPNPRALMVALLGFAFAACSVLSQGWFMGLLPVGLALLAPWLAVGGFVVGVIVAFFGLLSSVERPEAAVPMVLDVEHLWLPDQTLSRDEISKVEWWIDPDLRVGQLNLHLASGRSVCLQPAAGGEQDLCVLTGVLRQWLEDPRVQEGWGQKTLDTLLYGTELDERALDEMAGLHARVEEGSFQVLFERPRATSWVLGTIVAVATVVPAMLLLLIPLLPRERTLIEITAHDVGAVGGWRLPFSQLERVEVEGTSLVLFDRAGERRQIEGLHTNGLHALAARLRARVGRGAGQVPQGLAKMRHSPQG